MVPTTQHLGDEETQEAGKEKHRHRPQRRRKPPQVRRKVLSPQKDSVEEDSQDTQKKRQKSERPVAVEREGMFQMEIENRFHPEDFPGQCIRRE